MSKPTHEELCKLWNKFAKRLPSEMPWADVRHRKDWLNYFLYCRTPVDIYMEEMQDFYGADNEVKVDE